MQQKVTEMQSNIRKLTQGRKFMARSLDYGDVRRPALTNRVSLSKQDNLICDLNSTGSTKQAKLSCLISARCTSKDNINVYYSKGR